MELPPRAARAVPGLGLTTPSSRAKPALSSALRGPFTGAAVCVPPPQQVLLSEPRNVQDVPVPQPGLQQLHFAAAADKLVRASEDSVTEGA